MSLAHIMGFLKPDQGRVFVAYEDITDFDEAQLRDIRKKVTMVFQSGALFDSLTVAENILFSLELREDYDEKQRRRGGRPALARRPAALPRFLSGGSLPPATGVPWRSPAPWPPNRNASSTTSRRPWWTPSCPDTLIKLMLKLKYDLKLTGLVVTHDLDLMRKVADRVMFIYEGKAIYFGPVKDLEKCDHPHIREFLAMDRVEIVPGGPGA